MKVLVTGACGFIGRHVVNELVRWGVDVVATDIKNIEESGLMCYNNIRYIQHDFSTASSECFDTFGRPDKVIHLAWRDLPNYDKEFHITYNAMKSYDFLKAMIASGLKDVTCIGTCAEYGMVCGEVHESIPSDPPNNYAIGKDLLRKMLEKLPINFKWPRLFYLFGPGQRPTTLFALLEKARINGDRSFKIGKGEQLRDFLPVGKVAEYIVKVALQESVTGIINICSGRPISVRRFIEDYLKSTGSSMVLELGDQPYNSYEPMAFWGSRKKLDRILNES